MKNLSLLTLWQRHARSIALGITLISSGLEASWFSNLGFGRNLQSYYQPLATSFSTNFQQYYNPLVSHLQPHYDYAAPRAKNFLSNRWVQAGLALAGTGALAYTMYNRLHAHPTASQSFTWQPSSFEITTPGETHSLKQGKEFLSIISESYKIPHLHQDDGCWYYGSQLSESPEPRPKPSQVPSIRSILSQTQVTGASQDSSSQQPEPVILILNPNDPMYKNPLSRSDDEHHNTPKVLEYRQKREGDRLTRINQIATLLQQEVKDKKNGCASSCVAKPGSACQQVHQLLTQFTKNYACELQEAQKEPETRDDKSAYGEAQAIYQAFVLKKNRYKDIFDQYAPAYNQGLQALKDIHNNNKTTLTKQDTINIQTYFLIKAMVLRDNPIDQSTFIVVNGKKLGDLIFQQQGLMQNGLATHFEYYGTDVHHNRLCSQLQFPTFKEELLGGHLPSVVHPQSGSTVHRTYFKLEDCGVNGSLIKGIHHLMGFPASKARRYPGFSNKLILPVLNYAITTAGYDPMKPFTNDQVNFAKEHAPKVFETIFETITQIDTQTDIPNPKFGFQTMVPYYRKLQASGSACQKYCASLVLNTIENLFTPEEAELLYAKHGMEITFDMNDIVRDTPLVISKSTAPTNEPTVDGFVLVSESPHPQMPAGENFDDPF